MVEINNFYDYLNCFKEEGDLNLLLGNGFSIGLDVRFKNKSIQESLVERNKNLNDFFKKFETSNIEKIMEGIEITKEVLLILGKSEFFNHEEYINEIKDVFLKTITDIHPCNSIEDDKISKIKKFLKEINNIFTTNYDLMLYWIVMELLHKEEKIINDGFFKVNGQLLWQEKFEQNLFYLHGALHMHTLESGDIIKNVYKRPFDTLIKQLMKKLDGGNWPMIVLEGTSNQKLKAIESSRYLKNALCKFKEIKGTIFIHGFSFNINDAHIYNAILENVKLEHICIGVSQENCDTFTSQINELSKKTIGKNKICFYDRDKI